MIERRWSPAACGVTKRAVSREPGRNMVRAGRSVVVRFVTRDTSRRRACVYVVDVTLCARHICMHACQRIVRVSSVIESGIKPVDGGVTTRAIVGQPKLQMTRVSGPGKVRRVAAIAGRRSPLVLVVDVACSAGLRCMRSG